MTEQADLFSTIEQRPEDDEFVREIIARFEGRITSIKVARESEQMVWLETLRERSEKRYAPRPKGEGRPAPVRCDFTVHVHNRTKSKNGIAIHPWRLEWSVTHQPLLVGLFESEQAANDYRRK